MANTTISPNMSLIIPTVSVDPGPDWANNLNSSLSIIDQHNHASGSGVQINQTGITLSPAGTSLDSLVFGSGNASGLRSVRFTPQGSALALGTDVGCIYEAGVDLYYNDGNGNQIRLTQGGSIVGTAGSISGLPSGTASASYSAGTFVWQSATSTAATMDGGPYIFRNTTASSHGVTVSPPSSLPSNYSLFLPSIPGAQSILSLDTSGNMLANYTVDGSTIVIASNIIKVPTGGITATQIANSTITATQIASATITATQIANTTITATQIANGTLTGTQFSNNPNFPGKTVQENSLNVVVSNTNASTNSLSIIRATINGGGTVTAGEGILSVNNSSTGIYVLTFTTGFTDTPVAVASATSSDVILCTTSSIGTGALTVSCYNTNTAALAASSFSVIIIGQRV